MVSGDIDDTALDPGELDKYRRSDPVLDNYLSRAWMFKPVRTFFIPFGAGISYDGKTVYISYDIQTVIEEVECENAMVRHETTEWALRHFLDVGEDYANDPLGHRIANGVEFARVRQLLDRDNAVEIYQEIIDTQVFRTEREDFDDKPIPRDLAMYPYEDETALHSKLMEAMWNDRSEQEWMKLHPEEVEDVPSKPPSAAVVDRLKRDAFLYLDPKPPNERFAQCSTCRDWIVHQDMCYIHGQGVAVPGSASCGLYVRGAPLFGPGIRGHRIVTPEESGLVDREVRCENCKWFADGICMFFKALNMKAPTMFDLDEKVDAKGCCNANQAK